MSTELSSTGFSLGTVEVSSSPQERFADFLQSKGKRITQQRRILVDYVFKRHDHFDAEELILNLAQQPEGRKVSRPTVYRTLNELVDAGLLRRMKLRGRAIYEHDYGYPQHDHLYCTSCEQLIEFQSSELQSLRRAVARGVRLPRHGPPADHLGHLCRLQRATATVDIRRWIWSEGARGPALSPSVPRVRLRP